MVTEDTPAVLPRQLTVLGYTDVQDFGADHGLRLETVGRTEGRHHSQTHRLVSTRVGVSCSLVRAQLCGQRGGHGFTVYERHDIHPKPIGEQSVLLLTCAAPARRLCRP